MVFMRLLPTKSPYGRFFIKLTSSCSLFNTTWFPWERLVCRKNAFTTDKVSLREIFVKLTVVM